MDDVRFCTACRKPKPAEDRFCCHCGADQSFEAIAARAADALVPQEPRHRSMPAPLLVVVAFLAVLLVVGVGVWVWNRPKPLPPQSAEATPDQSSPAVSGSRSAEDTQSPPDPDNGGNELGDEPAPRPAPVPDGLVTLEGGKFLVERNRHGDEFIVGRIRIENHSPSTVDDFRLSLEVGVSAYVLVPFEGSPLDPRRVLFRSIPSGSSLEVPVMTTGFIPSWKTFGTKRVFLRASLSGPPYSAEDEATIR
jgi:hypothetical protein